MLRRSRRCLCRRPATYHPQQQSTQRQRRAAYQPRSKAWVMGQRSVGGLKARHILHWRQNIHENHKISFRSPSRSLRRRKRLDLRAYVLFALHKDLRSPPAGYPPCVTASTFFKLVGTSPASLQIASDTRPAPSASPVIIRQPPQLIRLASSSLEHAPVRRPSHPSVFSRSSLLVDRLPHLFVRAMVRQRPPRTPRTALGNFSPGNPLEPAPPPAAICWSRTRLLYSRAVRPFEKISVIASYTESSLSR